jgi:hypothetical protein
VAGKTRARVNGKLLLKRRVDGIRVVGDGEMTEKPLTTAPAYLSQ